MHSINEYRVDTTQGTPVFRAIGQIFPKHGQHLLPSFLGLAAHGTLRVCPVIDLMVTGLIELFLELSWSKVAGDRCRVEKDPSGHCVLRHGCKGGVVGLSGRKVRVLTRGPAT